MSINPISNSSARKLFLAEMPEQEEHSQEWNELEKAIRTVENLREKNLNPSSEDLPCRKRPPSPDKQKKLPIHEIKRCRQDSQEETLFPTQTLPSTATEPAVSNDSGIPVPDFSSFFPPKPAIKYAPPPTPRKTLRSMAKGSLFLELHQKAAKGVISIKGQDVTLTRFASGSFMDAYEVKASYPLLPGQNNDQLIFKTYNERQSAFPSGELIKYLQSSIDNYNKAQELGLAVATIYNIQTAAQDGFFLQEKIPFEIDISNTAHLEQVRKFFKIALENKVIFDLLPDNFRVKEDGEVVLIDFVEEIDDGPAIFFNHAIKLWGKKFASKNQGDKELTQKDLQSFTEGFDQTSGIYQPSWNAEIIANIFR